jgi:hypothetical protein
MLVQYVFGRRSILYLYAILFSILSISSDKFTVNGALDVAHSLVTKLPSIAMTSINLSSMDINMTTNKSGTNETIISITNHTLSAITQNQSNVVPQSSRPIINSQNNVDWISIAGVFGSAIAGAFFGSYLHLLFSSKYNRRREHLVDLKEKVVKPLYDRITSPDFIIRDLEFQSLEKDKGRKITTENPLYYDFMENHYPDIQPVEKEFYTSKRGVDNAAHDLRNKLYSTLEPILKKMKSDYTEDENTFNKEWLESLLITIVESTYDVMVSAIVDRKYDKSFFHITDSGPHRILYFFPERDDMIPFKVPSDKRLQYVIFEAKSNNEDSNITKANEVKNKLIQVIDKTLEERDEVINEYENIKSKYYLIRKQLADRLLMVTYSTKLEFKKRDLRTRLKFKKSEPNKKCSLT